MSEKNAKAERSAEMVMINKEVLGRIQMERALFKCLLGLMIFEANQGAGEVWRAVFSPSLIELGKTFELNVSTAAEGALPTDLLALAREHLKIELPPTMSAIDIGMIKSLIPAEVLRKTFVLSVAIKPHEAEKLAEKAAEEKRRAELTREERSTIRNEAGEEVFKLDTGIVNQEEPAEEAIEGEPDREEEVRAPRSRSRYCSTCHEIYTTTEGEPHTCTPIIH
jgi:hypothetical protein